MSSKKKTPIKLSENLQMGIAAPASQGTFFKVGGSIFLILSAVLAIGIFSQLHASSGNPEQPTSNPSQQVLGAYSDNTAPVQTVTYAVQKGDTLFDIAQAKNVSWQVIATLNNLSQPYSLKPGMQLKLPAQQ
jgi:LysM repeat protein